MTVMVGTPHAGMILEWDGSLQGDTNWALDIIPCLLSLSSLFLLCSQKCSFFPLFYCNNNGKVQTPWS